MSNIDLLNNSSNPLNIDSIRKIIELYSFNSNLHTSIMSANKRNNSRISNDDKNLFNYEMFSLWKNRIINTKMEEARELFEEVKIDKDFIPLRNFIIKNKDVENPDEFVKLIEENGLKKTYDAYKWNSKGKANTPWIYVTSNNIFSHKSDPFNITHNLFINTNCDDTYNMSLLFVKKCEEEKIPYLFKISESPFRDDSIIIYSSDELLDKHMNILEKIKEENPDLISRINNPPILTAKVDYYGYGSEPNKNEEGRLRSYSVLRSNMIEDVVADSARRWFYANRNLSLNGFTIMDAIVKECSDRVLTSMKKNYNNAMEYEKELAKKNNTPYSDEALYQRLGYNIEMLEDSEFINKLSSNIRANMPTILKDEKLFKRYPTKDAIVIPLNEGKTYAINYSDITRIIKRNSVGITKFDNNFINKVMESVQIKCDGEKIKQSNFAFNTDFKVTTKVEEKEQEEEPVKETIKFPKFDELKNLAANYKVEFDKESNRLKVYEIETGKSEEDVVKAQDALFANIWLNSAGLKPVEGEKRPGLTDAFDVDGAILYKFFVKGCQHSIEKTGNLNSLFLFKNSSKLKMTNADKEIVNLFNNDYQTIFLDNYVHARCESTLPRTKNCEALIDMETANKRLEAALNKKKK